MAGPLPPALAADPLPLPPALPAQPALPALPAPEFRLDADALWFWVPLPGAGVMRASISRSVLRYRFDGQPDGSDAVAVYTRHRVAIDAAVQRRAAAGSLEPVMLREFDLRA